MLGGPAPFDRHDWIVDRCGKEVRYVIDFYFYDEKAGTPQVRAAGRRGQRVLAVPCDGWPRSGMQGRPHKPKPKPKPASGGRYCQPGRGIPFLHAQLLLLLQLGRSRQCALARRGAGCLMLSAAAEALRHAPWLCRSRTTSTGPFPFMHSSAGGGGTLSVACPCPACVQAFEIVARPALDSFESALDRAKMAIYVQFAAWGLPCPISGHANQVVTPAKQ